MVVTELTKEIHDTLTYEVFWMISHSLVEISKHILVFDESLIINVGVKF